MSIDETASVTLTGLPCIGPGSPSGSSPGGAGRHLAVARLDSSEGSLARAAEEIARVDHDIGLMWCHALSTDGDATGRLVEVSRMLRRASRLLGQPPGIG